MRRKILKALDLLLAGIMPSTDADPDRLVVLAFHSVLPDIQSLEAEVLDPYQPLTVADIEAVILTLQGRGYRFVTGRDLADGRCSGPAVWLTFDDGYANNLGLLPVLKRFHVPATVFVATGYVDSGEAYWWDILYRESRLRGAHMSEIVERREGLKALHPDKIRAEVVKAFGTGALRPVGDLDRPMTAEELAGLSREPLVEIGNHTHSHTILTRVGADAQKADVALCQDRLAQITGTRPLSIAYPNGNANPGAVSAAQAAGLRIGVTCAPKGLRITSLSSECLEIGRFAGLRHGVLDREISLATARYSASQLLGHS